MVSDFETCWWQTTNYLSSQLTKVSNTEIDQTKLRDRCEHNFVQLGFPESRITEKSPVEYWFIKTKAKVFIQKMMAWLKLNEIRSIIKMGSFSKVEFCSKTFLQHLWKFNKIAKINCSIATLYLLNTHHGWILFGLYKWNTSFMEKIAMPAVSWCWWIERQCESNSDISSQKQTIHQYQTAAYPWTFIQLYTNVQPWRAQWADSPTRKVVTPYLAFGEWLRDVSSSPLEFLTLLMPGPGAAFRTLHVSFCFSSSTANGKNSTYLELFFTAFEDFLFPNQHWVLEFKKISCETSGLYYKTITTEVPLQFGAWLMVTDNAS